MRKLETTVMTPAEAASEKRSTAARRGRAVNGRSEARAQAEWAGTMSPEEASKDSFEKEHAVDKT
jgi:hypothetical protein